MALKISPVAFEYGFEKMDILFRNFGRKRFRSFRNCVLSLVMPFFSQIHTYSYVDVWIMMNDNVVSNMINTNQWLMHGRDKYMAE